VPSPETTSAGHSFLLAPLTAVSRTPAPSGHTPTPQGRDSELAAVVSCAQTPSPAGAPLTLRAPALYRSRTGCRATGTGVPWSATHPQLWGRAACHRGDAACLCRDGSAVERRRAQ